MNKNYLLTLFIFLSITNLNFISSQQYGCPMLGFNTYGVLFGWIFMILILIILILIIFWLLQQLNIINKRKKN